MNKLSYLKGKYQTGGFTTALIALGFLLISVAPMYKCSVFLNEVEEPKDAQKVSLTDGLM